MNLLKETPNQNEEPSIRNPTVPKNVLVSTSAFQLSL